MFNIIINVLSYLISIVLSIVLAPVTLLLNALTLATNIDFNVFFTSINQFISYGLTYFNFFIDLLCIPAPLFVIVLTFNIAMLTFYLGFQAVSLFLRAYNAFKL